MAFNDAIKRPFQDMKTFLIGVIVMLIPIVNITVGLGYILKCAETGLKKNKKLPEWKDWSSLFAKGIGSLVIGLIYSIPVVIVLLLTLGTAILAGGLAGLVDGSALASFNALTTLGIGMVITALVAVIVSLLSTVAIIRYAEKGKFGAAFELNAIFKKAFTGTYFAAWVISMIYAVIVVVLLAFIPFVGAAIGTFITGVTVYTFLAEAYKKA